MLEYKVLLISLIWMCSSCISRAQQSCTDDVTYIAAHVRVKYTLLSNPRDEGPYVLNASIQLYNDGTQSINAGSWAIYIPHIRLIEPTSINPSGKIFDDVKMKIEHINGDLYRLTPLQDFPGILPGGSIDIRFQGSDWQVSKTDVMPNWYVASDNTNISPQIIASTAGESLDFVSDFVTPDQWKRLPSDFYDPYTPEVRLDIDGVPDAGTANHHVIPTPLEINIDWTKRLNVLSHGWVIVENAVLVKEIGFLSGKTGLAVVQASDTPCNRYIQLENTTGITPFRANESYEISISHTQQTIHIKGQTPAGVFYGIQTLLSLLDSTEWPGEVGGGTVKDNPRFGYRGMHVDVARNFHTVSDLKRLMDVMTQYKLNVLHFHLTDDEGWRFEIPEIPELTEIGGKRCHDLTETRCIIPLLGSGPTLSNYGSGYYTVDQYKDLLRYASDRHIQVIPEFDMPGHSHAAIKSMEARYLRYNNSDESKAKEFLLRDFNDPSEYLSLQYYKDNAINPCLESTYRFITVLLQSVINMHADIQPLEIFHLGGDEAPKDAYRNSTSCAPFFANGTDLKHYFVQRISEIAANAGVDLAMWEDGFYEIGHIMNRTEFRPNNMYTNVWSNVWEWGNGGRAYEFANNNYKVVLSHATHLYFDFPVEPDPLERGYYWASRIVPMKKTFSYLPDSIYKNIDLDVNRMGYDQSSEVVCSNHACPALLESQRPYIIGMQGQIWSETVRTSEQFDYMVMPRILALAERSWHKASWEDVEDIDTLKTQRDEDWNRFANTLGHKELRRLDKLGAKYRVPIAGARVNNDTGVLEWTSGLPGLPVRYTTDPDAKSWTDLNPLVPVIVWDKDVHIQIGSADSSRFSRSVQLEPVQNPTISSASIIRESIISIIFALLFTLI